MWEDLEFGCRDDVGNLRNAVFLRPFFVFCYSLYSHALFVSSSLQSTYFILRLLADGWR